MKRDLLMDFQGRSRKPQIELAKRLNIRQYPSPAGGCLLTEKAFSRRLKDLLLSNSDLDPREIELLKLGRHFRIASHTKLVVGRNKRENEQIHALSRDKDIILTTVSVPGPTVLVSGDPSEASLDLTAAITVAYSDARAIEATAVRVIGKGGDRIRMARVHNKEEFRQYMIQ